MIFYQIYINISLLLIELFFFKTIKFNINFLYKYYNDWIIYKIPHYSKLTQRKEIMEKEYNKLKNNNNDVTYDIEIYKIMIRKILMMN